MNAVSTVQSQTYYRCMLYTNTQYKKYRVWKGIFRGENMM